MSLRTGLISCLSALLLLAACDEGGTGLQGTNTVRRPATKDEDVADWKGNPVDEFGQLQVDGVTLRSEDGRLVQLKGVSSMWLNWEANGFAESKEALKYLRDEWHLGIVRAAMGIEPGGAYLTQPEKAEQQIDTIVQNATELGLYVIIDWHDHHAQQHQEEAEAFFSKMADKYGDLPNVLYEPFNEPEKVTDESGAMRRAEWARDIKPYHEAVLKKIRAKDPDNIVILGTSNWSQDVEIAAQDPVEGDNLMYTLHFYACDHQDNIIQKGKAAIAAGAALFVTEWGATPADGGSAANNNIRVCEAPTALWHDFMNLNAISWTAWKFDNCDNDAACDSSCMLKSATPVDGPFPDEALQGHGPLVRDYMLGK